MKLIIGGYAQGRLPYVLRRYNLRREDVFDLAKQPISAWAGQPVLYHVEELVTQAMETQENWAKWVTDPKWQHCIFITQEVGCGLVPVSAEERQWREAVGRMNIMLATQAETVERIFCGLSMQIGGVGCL
jgi:adenosylcobinamide kinase/adenosylcobinamide-phosphate guanylyltransferase